MSDLRAGEVKERAGEVIGQQVAQQKDQLVDQVDGVGRALRRVAENLRDEGGSPIAGYVERAADKLDDLTQGLRGKQPADLLRSAESYARREPLICFGVALAAGLAISRFLKSSSDRARPPQALTPIGEGGY